MDKYKVNIIITTTAKNNLKSTHKYISDNLKSSIAANKLISEIKSKILNLKEYPYIGSKILNNYHKLTVKKYVVLYIVVQNENEYNVNIIHVVYGGSNYLKLLS